MRGDASESTETRSGPVDQTRKKSCAQLGLAGDKKQPPPGPKESAMCPGSASAGPKGRRSREVLPGSEEELGDPANRDLSTYQRAPPPLSCPALPPSLS